MSVHSPPTLKVRQHSKLAHALTLALGLSVSSFALSASADHAPLATIPVQNCNDSGSGSLRNAVGQASSGDIIDLSALACSEITLQSALIIPQENLTLRGKVVPSFPGLYSPTITTDLDIRLLRHNGSGKLKLSRVSLERGKAPGFGGCVDSPFGGVELDSASLKYCTVENSNSNVGGGAIYAGKDVKLTNSTISSSKALAPAGTASGGAIFAKGNVVITDGSRITNNAAEGTSAFGGGIFSSGTLNAALNRSTISGNKAIGSSGDAHGGGAFVGGTTTVGLGGGIAVTGNQAIGPEARGGGLFLSEASDFKYSAFEDNTVKTVSSGTPKGGGIYSKTGTLSLDGCTITGNKAGALPLLNGIAGGISASALDLKNSTVAENHATLNAGGMSIAGNTKIASSTISNNVAMRVAGASIGPFTSQPISIQQSTISGNESSNSRYGAGLYLSSDTVIKNSTITGNIERNAQNKKYGAGISIRDGKTVELSSTIVSGNTLASAGATTGSFPSDIGVGFTGTTATLTGTHNLIAHSEIPTPGDTISKAPGLGPLQDNGGPTWTHKPLDGSWALDSGITNGYITDQRGSGWPRVVGSAADIGAVEYSLLVVNIFSDGFEN